MRFNFKFILCSILNIILLWFSIVGYQDVSRKSKIIKEEKPVTVQILDTYGGRGRSSCKVKFNNHIYENITLPNLDLKRGTTNSVYFYYDREKDIVFSNNLQVRAINFIFILFIVSVLLWLVPKKHFNL